MRRAEENPILTREDIPDVPPQVVDPTSVFNPGALEWKDGVMLLLRVQARSRETFLMPAWSPDGVNFEVFSRIVEIQGLEEVGEPIYHVYDPRLTLLEGAVYVVFAADIEGACRLGVARTEDFEKFELVSFDRKGDSRNGVLFPEKVGGRYLRLERPNRLQLEGGPTSGEEIVLSESEDLVTWRPVGPVMRGNPHYWDERIGSGPPPIKTREGWLHVYHGIATHFQSANIYQAGAVLLDLEDPTKVLARTRSNILEPREPYELIGQVPNVVFPSGIVVRDKDEEGFAPPEAEVLVYYGAADTTVGLARTTVGELFEECREWG